MPEAIPPAIAPYLQHTLSHQSLTLVTSTLSTPAHWVLLRHVYAALSGTGGKGNHAQSQLPEAETQQPVILVSLLRSRDLWLELSKKISLDLPSLTKSNHFVYIDGLTYGSIETSSSLPATKLKSLALEDISDAISRALEATRTQVADQERHAACSTVIVDGLDFLLASQPGVDGIRLQQFVTKTLATSQSLIISCNADSPLLHNRDESASPLEREHAAFITAMAHQARLVLQLRGLDTGAARDVTGVVRVSNGGNYGDPQDTAPALDEGEWLYQCKGDGSVRVWARGE